MNKLFARYLTKGILVYLDDIIVYGKTWTEFLDLLRAAFTILRDANLSVKREKCVFGAPELKILGHVVSRDGIRSAVDRIDAVLAIPFPRNARELRRFLGMTNYMRDYIPHYSTLAKPLTREINNPVTEWPRVDMEVAFNELKTVALWDNAYQSLY
jgi:hypothetical protein